MEKASKARQSFIEEAREDLLPELEAALLELGNCPDDMGDNKDLINRVFRALHTLKGSGAMFGFDRLSGLAHELETVFDGIRNGHHAMGNHLVELALTAKDLFQLLIDTPESVTDENINELVHALRTIVPQQDDDTAATDNPVNGKKDLPPQSAWTVYHIRFKPRPGIFATGTNPLFLLDELYELGTARAVAHIGDIPLLEEMDPEACYTWWDILLATDSNANVIKDVFIFVEGECDLAITVIAEGLQPGDETAAFDSLENLLASGDDIDPDMLQQFFPEAAPTADADKRAGVSGVSPASGTTDSASSKRQSARVISSMRVPAAKLDKLVNLVGELVIARTRLSRLADERRDDPALAEISEVIERLSNDLRENTLDIRMMPIGSSFGKFKRVVWDFSSQTGKEVELITEGAATELDKTVIERLDDPLVHLLRNSIDHGIEPPEERVAAGKPRQGKIIFSAEHSGGHVNITIADDGRGIDLEAVRARAVARGLLAPETALTDPELLKVIFEPGFSTASRVSDLSGRGVGMDVVKQSINALRGKVRVESEKGRGTTVRMTIPLTLAIIDGLQVRISHHHFIIPLSVVNKCLELEQQQSGSGGRKRFIHFRDQLVPFLCLRDCFSINGGRPDKEQVVIVSAEKKMVGLIVDEVVGLQQTVIKTLGEAYKDVPGISGATIQGDGSLALILDVDSLINKAREQ